MDRNYTNGSHNDNDGNRTFVGTEVENTPMKGQRTLFVVGIQNPDAVVAIAKEQGINHIYLGANHSFKPDLNWEDLVYSLLKKDLWVTLDFDIQHTEWILECGFTEYNRFIPMISAKLPYISQLGYNACLKLDDKDFDATNPGVWVHSLHNLLERNTFTSWDQYTGDTLV